MEICCMTQRTHTGLHDNQDGRQEAQEGGDIRIPVADPCGCMAETNTILLIILQLKFFNFNYKKKRKETLAI